MTSERTAPLVGLVMGSDSDWPVMEPPQTPWPSSASPLRQTSCQLTACH